MRIIRIDTCGLRGATPEGGWSHELQPDDIVHTLVAVHTDEGTVGIGSAFTSEALVRGAIDLLSPHLIGENPVEVERLTETLHQTAFWMGRGGALTHATSAIDIALWDIAGQASSQPVGRLLGGRHREKVRPYASVLMDEAGPMTANLEELVASGFSAFKIGWWKFGRVDAATDEATVAAARAAVGDRLLAVDAGGSEAFFPGDVAWAKRTARMLADYDVAWFEEALAPDNVDGPAGRASSPTSTGTPSTSCSPTPRKAGASASPVESAGQRRTAESVSSPMDGTRASGSLRTCSWLPRSRRPTWWNTRPAPRTSTT